MLSHIADRESTSTLIVPLVQAQRPFTLLVEHPKSIVAKFEVTMLLINQIKMQITALLCSHRKGAKGRGASAAASTVPFAPDVSEAVARELQRRKEAPQPKLVSALADPNRRPKIATSASRPRSRKAHGQTQKVSFTKKPHVFEVTSSAEPNVKLKKVLRRGMSPA